MKIHKLNPLKGVLLMLLAFQSHAPLSAESLSQENSIDALQIEQVLEN